MTVILHLHVPRALGSSLHQALFPYGRSDGTLAVNRRGQFEVALADGIRPKLVTGHFAFGLHELLGCPFVYFIPVRDPVERVWSLFRFMAANPAHPRHEFAKSVRKPGDIYDDETRGTQFDNSMTRQLAGIEDNRPLTRATLDMAIHNATREDVIAFPVGDIRGQLSALSRSVGHQFQTPARTNSAPEQALTSEWRAAIEQHNQMDRALFDAVRTHSRLSLGES